MVARAVLLLVALAAAGWLASSYPGARDEARADEIRPGPDGRLAPAQIATAITLLEGAQRARPDSTLRPRLAGMHLSAGRPGRAAELVRPLTIDEPENIAAWTVLALAESDPRAARRAQERQRELAPPPRR